MAQCCLAKAVKGLTCPSEFVIIESMGSDLCTLFLTLCTSLLILALAPPLIYSTEWLEKWTGVQEGKNGLQKSFL